MNLKPADEYFRQQEEPAKSCLLFLRSLILETDPGISEAWKYRMPFYVYHNKMCCYLWLHKKYKQPYIGIVEGKQMQDADLLQEERSRMKILLVDPLKDIPVLRIKALLKTVLSLYH